MPTKLALVVSGWSDLIDSLEALLQERSGTVQAPDTRCGGCEEIVERWRNGGEADWSALYRDQQVMPRRVSLPGYPFRKERHWFSADDERCAEPPTISLERSGDGGGSARPDSSELRAFIRETIARLLGVPIANVNDESDYFALGLSSQQLVTLAKAIGAHLARPFMSGMLFDASTVAELASAIVEEHAESQAPNLRNGSERPAEIDDSDRGDSMAARARISSALEEYGRGRLSSDDVIRLIDMEASGGKS